ncbi:hypothetical protein GCM10027093_04320 [Paraburkholderia jirisanensis]
MAYDLFEPTKVKRARAIEEVHAGQPLRRRLVNHVSGGRNEPGANEEGCADNLQAVVVTS